MIGCEAQGMERQGRQHLYTFLGLSVQTSNRRTQLQ